MRSILFLVLIFPIMTMALDERFGTWAGIKTPAPGPAESVGSYSAGCLMGAERLPLDGPGFSMMRPSRRRLFTHPTLAAYIRNLGQTIRQQNLPYLLIGDASPPRGGPMATGHNSHQTGLDVDIWLRMSSKRPTSRERESWSAPRFVRNRKTLLNNWSSTQVRLITAAAQSSVVNRIFVAPAIKKYFCDKTPNAPWLYRLRAWWGHEEHMHVRLNCPGGTDKCTPQTALDPTDNGCGEDLAWWFSKEADDDWEKLKNSTEERAFPDLPSECEQLVESTRI